MKKDQKQLIERFFGSFPPTHAIPRANEALAIRSLKLQSPVLDLGCGDGQFALLTFGKKGIEVGLDPNEKEAVKAQKSGAYLRVEKASGSKMPFENGYFSTAISNSVLEHVEDLNGVLKEASRVLRREGSLIITVPTPLVCQYQFWSKFIPGWAGFKRRLWRHINYFGEKEWQKRLEKCGFKIVKIEKTNSKAAIAWADIFLPVFLAGPLGWTVNFLERRRAFGLDKGGATLLIVAEKK